jgi:PII-like signaling protein
MAAGIVAPFRVMAVQVTIYLTEGDAWHHRPLHLEILKYLREENVFGAVAFHAVAGFLGRGKVHTAHLVEAGGELPVVISFVDTDEHVNRVLSKLREMAAHRLIVRENVVIEQGSLD